MGREGSEGYGEVNCPWNAVEQGKETQDTLAGYQCASLLFTRCTGLSGHFSGGRMKAVWEWLRSNIGFEAGVHEVETGVYCVAHIRVWRFTLHIGVSKRVTA